MADVQLEHGYLRLANRLAIAVALAPWGTGAQPRMILALIRCTYGMRRRTAAIGGTEWRALTGLSERHVKETKRALQDAGVIELVADFDARTHTPQTWRLRKDFTKWGPYAVAESVVDAAESVAVSTVTPVQDSAPRAPERTGGVGRDSAPGQGQSGAPGQGRDSAPPTGSNAADDNELQRRKTGKTRKTATTTTNNSSSSSEQSELQAYVLQAFSTLNSTNRAVHGDGSQIVASSHGSRQNVIDWFHAGIPTELVRRVVIDRTKRCDRAVTSMRYFNAAVREEHRKSTGGTNGRSNGAGAKGAPRRDTAASAAGARARRRRRHGDD